MTTFVITIAYRILHRFFIIIVDMISAITAIIIIIITITLSLLFACVSL